MQERTHGKPITLTHSATWALEVLSRQRYGRNPPALSWSISQELSRAGFVNNPIQGRRTMSITPAGHEFLRAHARAGLHGTPRLLTSDMPSQLCLAASGGDLRALRQGIVAVETNIVSVTRLESLRAAFVAPASTATRRY
jgi:hypothetical protein